MVIATVRIAAAICCCFLLAMATGCVAAPPSTSATSGTTTTTAATTSTSPPTTRTTTTTDPCTESGEWLSLSRIAESEAMERPAEERVNFSELFPAEQDVVRKALEYDCAIHQNTFGFGDENPSVIVYEGEYYQVRVGVRRVTTTVE